MDIAQFEDLGLASRDIQAGHAAVVAEAEAEAGAARDIDPASVNANVMATERLR